MYECMCILYKYMHTYVVVLYLVKGWIKFAVAASQPHIHFFILYSKQPSVHYAEVTS